VVPVSDGVGNRAVVAESRIIYLNKDGVTLLPGHNDSRNNTSTLASAATTLKP
jgi:hypothetical protein